MRPITPGGIARSVGRSVTLVSPAKMAEPLEMPFVKRTLVGQMNHVLDGGPHAQRKGTIFEKRVSHCKVQ